MSLSKETRDTIKNTVVTRVDKVFAALFPGCGVDSNVLGFDEEFLDSLIDDHYLALFTEDEITEMTAYQAKFAERSALLETRIEETVGARIEENKAVILAKVGAAQ